MWSDLRYAVRGLVKTPGFSIVAVVVLALAVAVNTAIFSLVNALFFRPLPVKNPGELAFIYVVDAQRPKSFEGLSFEYFEALKSRTDVFEDGAHKTNDSVRIVVDGIERRQSGEMVTGRYFHTLGVPALLGRTLMPEDEAGDATPVMVISEALWRGEFHSDPGVIGRVVPLITDSERYGYYSITPSQYTVVGVVASPFGGLGSVWSPVSYWVPSIKRIQDFRDPYDGTINASYLQRMGRPIFRRRPGVSPQQANAVAEDVARAAFPENAARHPQMTFVARDSRRVMLPFDPGMRVVPERLAGAVMSLSGLVLLIAVSNLIGLFSARGIAQRGEIAIRQALGATRARLARHFVMQGLSIATLSGALGLLIAAQALKMFSATAPTQISNGGAIYSRQTSFDVPIDWRVWLFGALLPIAASLVIAATRARQAGRTDVRGALQAGAHTTVVASRRRLRYAVVVPQIAASLAILLVAGMFTRALLASELAAPGYDPAQVSLIDFDMPMPSAQERQTAKRERQVLETKLREFTATIGGVSSVAITSNMISSPLRPQLSWVVAQDPRQPNSRGGLQWVGEVVASPGYVTTLGLKVVRGRDLADLDQTSSKVALVSVDLARSLWPGEDPIGKRFSKTFPNSNYPPDWMEVVGVVNDVRPPTADGKWNPVFYTPPGKQSLSGTLVARGPGRRDDVMREVVAALKKAEPRARVTRSQTLTSAISELRYPRLLATVVLVGTGVVGLVLAAIGLFGVVSYSVAQRRREMGVRRALGADRRDIISLVVREGMAAAAVGTAAGLVLGYWVVRLAHRFALPIPPASWWAIGIVPAVLALVVFLACLVPARRAANVDPIVVLRDL